MPNYRKEGPQAKIRPSKVNNKRLTPIFVAKLVVKVKRQIIFLIISTNTISDCEA